MPDDFLFNKEEGIIREGEKFLCARHDESTLQDAYSVLLKDYKKLYTQSKRLVRMNDRQQAELSQKTKELNLRNQFIKKTFGRYLSDDVVENLLESPDGLSLGGQSRVVTVMFTDLRGFSAICEDVSPATVVEMLNDYLKEMTHIIFKYSGTINEIMGDGILLLFGAPIARVDDADRAIACALEMQAAMEEVNTNNRAKGLPELEMGVGINTGSVIVGNVGSDMRVKYAVVGSNVNLAARVESFTVGGQILVTQSTLDALTGKARVAGEFAVPFKGFKEPVTIHDIAGISGNYNFSLNSAKVDFRVLEKELDVEIEVMDGTLSGGRAVNGKITSLASNAALLMASIPLTFLSNLKLTFGHGVNKASSLHAKVLKCHDDGSHEIRFTSALKEVRDVFARWACQRAIEPREIE
jgi:adenylate cyclase